MNLNLIFARAANGVIGAANTIPWHLPEDMAHFKARTLGAPVIMGRKTWDSLPPRFRPLPGRRNIVVTRQADWQAEGAQRVGSLREAIEVCERLEAPDVWVIGGAQIYAEAEPFARRALVTEIARDYEGDAFAPVLDASACAASSSRPRPSSRSGSA
ncbi:dihydrofolate reductase [Variovorax paradoxus]|uniref:dihydrofolate reductase n=1 Tax=Variovorax paradoxus TaxID=34073 RepID=UPI001ABBF094